MQNTVGNQLVSVIIPVYCRSTEALQWLSEALESVKRQSYTNIQIIIADDCSPIDITPLLYTLPENTVYFRNTENIRQAGCRQKAVNAADGDIIAFLDQDDLWEPNHLSSLLNVMDSKQADMVFADISFLKMGDADSPVCHIDRRNIPYESSFLSLFQRGNYIVSFSCCLIKKAAIEAAGGMNTAYTSMDDFELFLKISEKGRIIFCSEKTVHYRIHVAAANRKVKLFNDSKLLLRLYFRHFASAPSAEKRDMLPRLIKKTLALIYYRIRNK